MSRAESSPSLAHDDHADEAATDLHEVPETLDDPVDTGVHARYVDDAPDEAAYDPDAPRPSNPANHRRTTAARERMLARRRRTLGVLAGLAVVTLALAVLVAPWVWVAQAVVDLLLLAYLYHLRNEAIREAERRELREARFAPKSRPQRRIFEPPTYAEGPLAEDPEARWSDPRVVRIDDEDPDFYELGGSAPLGHDIDLSAGPETGAYDVVAGEGWNDEYEYPHAVGA